MGKKSEKDLLAEKVAKVLADAGDDRDRISKFLDDLINSVSGTEVIGIAEYVSKIADALTRQNQLRVAALKVEQKAGAAVSDDDSDDIAGEIGLPFEQELDESSN